MAEACDEWYFFGFTKFFDFRTKVDDIPLDSQSSAKGKDEEEHLAYLRPKKLRLIEDIDELCITWSTILQVLRKSGTVKICGWSEGRIIASYENKFLPISEKIVALRGRWQKLVMISEKGQCHVINDVQNDGTVYSVTSGLASKDDVEGNTWFQSCDVGDTHCVAVDKQGKLYQIDEKKSDENSRSFFFFPLPLEVKIDEVSCGKEHVLLLNKHHGTVYSFGLGTRGQLGHGRVDCEKTPRCVEALAGIRIQQIAAGGWHSLALSRFGDVYSWGWNECGQLGIACAPPEVPTTLYMLPVIVEFPNELAVTYVGCGTRHSLAVTSEPEVDLWTWGWGYYGQLGHGNRENYEQPTVVEHFRGGDSRITRVQAGPWQTFIRLSKDREPAVNTF